MGRTEIEARADGLRPRDFFAQPQSSTRAIWPIGIAIVAFLLLVYAAFPTSNHYWDGIAFALNIEEACQNAAALVPDNQPPRGTWRVSFYPNHLLYNLFGCYIYAPVHYLAPNVRALHALRAVSVFASVASAYLVFLMLMRWSRDVRLSVWLTLLMAFSATWWKFSTDANVYVASAFFLVLCTFLLSNPRKPPPAVAVGLVHALGMLTHQIAIFFFPAVAVAIWTHPCWSKTSQRHLALLAYTLAAGFSVSAAYLWVWFGFLGREWSTSGFLSWLASNGAETVSHRSAVSSTLETARSSLRVFFGGRISLALAFVEKPLLLLMTALMLAALTCFLVSFTKQLRMLAAPFWRRPFHHSLTPATNFFVIWAASFLLFLSVWLTEYSYYRLLPSSPCVRRLFSGFQLHVLHLSLLKDRSNSAAETRHGRKSHLESGRPGAV